MLESSPPGGLPALVHCSAGKDRTGYVVAILLSALGVPYEAIADDYLRSASTPARQTCIEASRHVLEAVLGFGPHPDVVQVVSEVHREFLGAAFATIEREYGGVEPYLLACGVDRGALARLKALLLE
jgi:protein-tyrosine phosphatase